MLKALSSSDNNSAEDLPDSSGILAFADLGRCQKGSDP